MNKVSSHLSYTKTVILLVLSTLCTIHFSFLILETEKKENLIHIQNLMAQDMMQQKADFNTFIQNYILLASHSLYYINIQNFLNSYYSLNYAIKTMEFNNAVKELNLIYQTNKEKISTAWIANIQGNYYLDNNGNTNLNSSWDITKRPYYSQLIASKSTFIIEPSLSTTTKRIEFAVIEPIFKNNETYAAFGININYPFLSDFFEKKYTTDSKYFALFSQNNTVIYHKNKTLNFQHITRLPLPKEVINKVLNKEEGFISLKIPFEGKKYSVLFMISKTSIEGWHLVMAELESVYEEQLKKSFASEYLLPLFTLILLYLLFVFLIITRYFDNKKIVTLANLDSLTHLPTLKLFKPQVEAKLKADQHCQYAFVSFMVTKIHLLNEILGYKEGDNLIKHIGDSLEQTLTSEELASRVSGTKFSLLLLYQDNKSLLERLEELDKKITSLKSLMKKHFSIQLVYACYPIPKEKKDYSQIDACTDIALERLLGQDHYQSTFMFYDEKLKNINSLEKELENDMEEALYKKEYLIYLQGKYNVQNSKLISAEALVRWNHKTKGIIPPNSFIPLFEKNGFITKLDNYMIEEVCVLQRKWINNGISPVPIAVNLSRTSIKNSHIVEQIISVIDRYALPHNLIEVEITESAVSDNIERLIEVIKQFKENGISTAIDDFGTGYSTLGTLKKLNIDTLKFDREFFIDSHNDPKGRTIIRNIFTLARDLNLTTVSEGIEWAGQVEFLKESGGDLVQGYYFSKPIPEKEFEKLLISFEISI